MFFKKLLLVVGIFLLATANSHAATVAEECQKRAMSAYDKGSSDSERKKLGAAAASECFDSMEDSLKKGSSSSSASSSSVAGPFILLLVIGGFLAYKLATKAEKIMSPSQIVSFREQTRGIYRPDSGDLSSVRRFKETRLEHAETMFAAALSGESPIARDTMKDWLPQSRQDLENTKASQQKLIDTMQNLMDLSIKQKDGYISALSSPPSDENDENEMELRDFFKKHLAELTEKIEGYQLELAELRG